jgi:hypothetical protein
MSCTYQVMLPDTGTRKMRELGMGDLGYSMRLGRSSRRPIRYKVGRQEMFLAHHSPGTGESQREP